ncbi:hypothetical protein EDD11_000618 [Mortierella claussenii]|nr:hypothetical protein EDD11_000618 [Mortierella claussenii]
MSQLNLNSPSIYPYEDVTALLDDATKDMKVGQLVQLESFSLFDAMCAIVIMDPKMDTGMILDDYATRPQYDVNQRLNPKEFIWIIDNIIMTWLSGHALSQTLFTSCYILRVFEIDLDKGSAVTTLEVDAAAQQPGEQEHRPTQFVTLVLKSVVLAIAKACSLIWSEMKKGQVYEEEDFMANIFGVSLYDNFPASAMFAMLDQAEHWMEGPGKHWIKSHYNIEANILYKSVMERIQYARSFYMALFQVVAPKCGLFVEAITHLEAVRKNVQEIKSTYSLGLPVEGAFDHTIHRKLVTNTPPRAIALLTVDETFQHLDLMCQDLVLITGALQFRDASNLMNFFIQFARKRPAPGAFPRSILQTVLYNDRVIMGSRKVHNVIRNSIEEIVEPPPWMFESFDELQKKMEAASADSMSSQMPGIIPSIEEEDEDEVSVLKKQVQVKAVLFIESAIKPFVDTLQIAGQNTSRQRRNLRKMVQLWEGLQESAEAFDEEIHLVLAEIQTQSPLPPFYFVSWVYHMKLWTMEWLLLLGFELELYSTFEYSMIYGYIDCVLGAHAQHLRRVQTVTESTKQTGSKQRSSTKKKKKKKKTSGDKEVSTLSSTAPSLITPSIPAIRATQDMVTIRLQLARGIFLILAALTKVNHLSTTPPHLENHGLNDLQTLHRHRFKAFHHLSSPETMSYEAYLQRLDCDGFGAWQMLDYAVEFFSQAKVSLDRLQSLTAIEARTELAEDLWRQDIKNMINVCTASKQAIAGLQNDARILEQKEHCIKTQIRTAASTSAPVKQPSKGKEKGKQSATYTLRSPVRKVTFKWTYHSWWPVIGLA